MRDILLASKNFRHSLCLLEVAHGQVVRACRHLSDMKCTVMIWRSQVRTPDGLNLECVILLSESYLIQIYLSVSLLYINHI